MADTKAKTAAEQAAEKRAEEEKAAAAAAPDRAAIEAAATINPPLVGSIQTVQATADNAPDLDGPLADAAGNMALSAARSEAGRPFEPTPDPEHTKAVEKAREQRAKSTGGAIRGAGSTTPVINALRQALEPVDDGVDVVEPIPAPGLTERGWSPEVTARHPAVEAAMIEEMMGGGGAGPRAAGKVAGIDPTDTVALQDALRDQGFHEQRKIDLRNRAHRLAAERLAAADGARQLASPHSMAAMSELAAELRENADANGLKR